MIQKTWQRFKSRPLRKNINNGGHSKRPETVHVQNSSSRQAYFSQDQSYSDGGQASSSGGQPCSNGGHSLSSGGSCSSGDDFSKLEPPLRSQVLQSEQNVRKSYGTDLEFVQAYSEEAVHAQMINCENAAHAHESWAQNAVQEQNISSENATHAQNSWSQKAAHALKISGENAAHAQEMRNVKAAHAQEEEEGADLSLVLRTLAQHGLCEVKTVSLFTFSFYFYVTF
jgi:hypothetical protein